MSALASKPALNDRLRCSISHGCDLADAPKSILVVGVAGILHSGHEILAHGCSSIKVCVWARRVKIWRKTVSQLDRCLDNILGLNPCSASEGIVGSYGARTGKEGLVSPPCANLSTRVSPLDIQGFQNSGFVGNHFHGPIAIVFAVIVAPGRRRCVLCRKLLLWRRHGTKFFHTSRKVFDTGLETLTIEKFYCLVKVIGINIIWPRHVEVGSLLVTIL
mmetsp:Transcript_13834/g.34762  ORF Transcript_13834/g.34762 Transcript_13834/m.34762 type:complete len:218 (+) Transcript_13834:405-1058(+)